jgi:DNA-binding transcriptional MerR regulator
MGMTIGELARRGGVGVETVRFYQRRRLLDVPPKTARGRRSYGPAALRELRFIRRCQGLGLSLDEVAGVLRMRRNPSRPCGSVHRKIEATLATVDAKRRSLDLVATMLRDLLSLCSGETALGSCALLTALEDNALDSEVPGGNK